MHLLFQAHTAHRSNTSSLESVLTGVHGHLYSQDFLLYSQGSFLCYNDNLLFLNNTSNVFGAHSSWEQRIFIGKRPHRYAWTFIFTWFFAVFTMKFSCYNDNLLFLNNTSNVLGAHGSWEHRIFMEQHVLIGKRPHRYAWTFIFTGFFAVFTRKFSLL